MAVLDIPEAEPWFAARWEFRRLLESCLDVLVARDKEIVQRALALDGLHLSMIEGEAALRIGSALIVSAEKIRGEIVATKDKDMREVEFGEMLTTLVRQLEMMVRSFQGRS